MLLTQKFLAPVSMPASLLVLALASLLCLWLALVPKWNPLWLSIVPIALMIIVWLASYRFFLAGILFNASAVYLSIIGISLAGLIARQAEEQAEKRYITQLFGRYVAANVVKELIKNKDLVKFGGHKERLTIFFS